MDSTRQIKGTNNPLFDRTPGIDLPGENSVSTHTDRELCKDSLELSDLKKTTRRGNLQQEKSSTGNRESFNSSSLTERSRGGISLSAVEYARLFPGPPPRSEAPADFRFAPNYSIKDIMANPMKAESLRKDYLNAEAPYFSIGRHPDSGLSFDGIILNTETGAPAKIRNWSAPSKECLDIALCIKALRGDAGASLVVSRDDPARASEIAADILGKKMSSYEAFHRENPGYGGFIPWFISGEKLTPTPDWKGQIPGLDNGEWIWSLLVAEQALRDKGFDDLANRCSSYNKILRENVVKIFYDHEAGKVRGDIEVLDPHSPGSGYAPAPGKCDYLAGEHGVHEGSMMLLYISLFGEGLPEDAMEKIWKSTSMKRIETEWGTTWQAWAGSSHESWAHLFLPTRDIPLYGDLFRIREKIRSQNAAQRKYPGFASSTNEPGGSGYLSACGIEGIGTLEPQHNNVFALYGAFPMLLEFSGKEAMSGNYGLAWLLNMLKTQKMQGPLGGGESAANDGKTISPMKTIDGSFPNILALTGGLQEETKELLMRAGLYDKFKNVMERELLECFGDQPLREPVDFALPAAYVPTEGIPDYELPAAARKETTGESAEAKPWIIAHSLHG